MLAFDLQSLCRWIASVKKNYRKVRYHNWRHAFNVCQTAFCMLKTGNLSSVFSDSEQLALLIACLSHDLDHRGTNNAFQAKYVKNKYFLPECFGAKWQKCGNNLNVKR